MMGREEERQYLSPFGCGTFLNVEFKRPVEIMQEFVGYLLPHFDMVHRLIIDSG
jgi:hypothetical protein